jgi:hypothetical protein
LVFIHIEHICTFFSATIDVRDLIFGHKLHIDEKIESYRVLEKKILVSVIWSDTFLNFVSLNKLLPVRKFCQSGKTALGGDINSELVNEKLNENYLTNHMSKVGFGCDGASNMMGCKIGLITRLQECYPEVVGVKIISCQITRKGSL